MAKIVLEDVTNILGNPTSAQNTINNNSAAIEAALDNTLSRNGSTPNQMEADLDMNGNDILNVNSVDADNLSVDGQTVREFVEGEVADLREDLEVFVEQAGASAAAAAVSASAAANSAAISSAGATTATAAAQTAADLVVEATAGFMGFQDNLGYDFGFITSPLTYFDQDWGTLT